MAKNVVINGVVYSDVPYVNIPLSGATGNAKFVDTDSGDAVAGDIRSGRQLHLITASLSRQGSAISMASDTPSLSYAMSPCTMTGHIS